MLTNYHTHTHRCFHATGTEEEYVKTAIKAGFSELGFSDHSPYLFKNSYYSDFRMFPESYADYVDTVNNLKIKYKDQIKIYLGLELEYYPKCFDETLRFLLQADLDYLILGQHFTFNEYDGDYVYAPCFQYPTKRLIQYVDQTIEALNTGMFSYLAHPDLISYTKDDDIYTQEMTRLCKEAKKLDIPLEINLYGMRNNRGYPTERFFKIAAECQNKVILGFDSHSVDSVYSAKTKECIDNALNMIERLNLERVEKLTLIKPKL